MQDASDASATSDTLDVSAALEASDAPGDGSGVSGSSEPRRRQVLAAVEALARQIDIASNRDTCNADDTGRAGAGFGASGGRPGARGRNRTEREQAGRERAGRERAENDWSEHEHGENGSFERGRGEGGWSGRVGDGSFERGRVAGERSAGGRAAGGGAAGGRGGGGGGGQWGRRRWSEGASRDEPRREEPPRDEHEVAREICLKQLAVRPRTRAELATALHKRGISDEVAGAVLNRYDEVGLIDDAAFAKAWVNSRHHGRGLASRALAQELKQRGVSAEHAEEALSGLDADTEAQTALALATRKLRTMRGEPEAVFRRLVGMLARKGYPAGVAVRAVKEALATRDAEVAELIDPDAYEDE